MSLRTRLFLLIGGLAAVLVVAQWWLVRTLSRDVSSEVSAMAFRLGEGVVASMGMLDTVPVPGEPLAGGAPASEAAAPQIEMKPLPPGARTVTERQIRLAEKDGKLQVVDERVRVGRIVTSHGPAPLPMPDGASATPPAGASAESLVVVLSMDSADRASMLTLGGPGAQRHVPIPRAGVDEALEAFRRRLLAGSAALLFSGLALAAVIAHRATAPLRELSLAARKLGEGALGTQVPHAGGGEVAEAVVAFNSMSRRLAELDAESRRLREREHLTEVGEIARGLAHGLRNPLNALGLTVDELAADEPERRETAAPARRETAAPSRRETAAPRRRELAASARRQISRIDESIRSFLALAATASSAPEEDVDLVSLVQDVALHALQDARGRVSIGVEAGDDVPRLRGVSAEVRAVAQALVVNAVEASPEGARVVVRIENDGGGGARLTVEDEGAGLPETVRGKLFTPHVTTKASGSGMGLYLAHRVVSARHGGTLDLQPRQPRGTRATATFPARATGA